MQVDIVNDISIDKQVRFNNIKKLEFKDNISRHITFMNVRKLFVDVECHIGNHNYIRVDVLGLAPALTQSKHYT